MKYVWKNEFWKYVLIVITVLLVYAMTFSLVASPAQAQVSRQMVCVPIPIAVEKMKELHGEVPIFRGVSRGGYVIILFLNSETGTWTATQIAPPRPNLICAIDAGESGETHVNLIKKEIPSDKSKINW